MRAMGSDVVLPIVRCEDFPDLSHLHVPDFDESRPHREALAQGRLLFQACLDCQSLRWPIGPICPYCGSAATSWRSSTGSGIVFSWIRYHRAFLAELADVLPYVVVIVQLEDGPRLPGRLLSSGESLEIGAPVQGVICRHGGDRHTIAFVRT